MGQGFKVYSSSELYCKWPKVAETMTEAYLSTSSVARTQVSSNLGHGGRAFYEVAALGCFPADLGFLLEFGEPPLIDVVLLVEQVYTCCDGV
jgi:hypothetical protein